MIDADGEKTALQLAERDAKTKSTDELSRCKTLITLGDTVGR